MTGSVLDGEQARRMKSTLLDCPLGLLWQEAALCRLLVTADLSIGSNRPKAVAPKLNVRS